MYSSGFAPCDFWVSGALKWELHIEMDAKLVTAVNCFFQDLPPKEFHKTMTTKWKERMMLCIVNDSGYFEKDIVDHDDDDYAQTFFLPLKLIYLHLRRVDRYYFFQTCVSQL